MKLRAAVAGTIILAMIATPAVALAQATATAPIDDPLGVAVQLSAFFPWVILVSSVFVSPEHHAAVKRLIPGAVTVLTSVVYFIINGWPGLGAEVIAGIGGLATFSLGAYQPVSALLELVTGRTLNGIMGPGLPIGPSEADELRA